MVCPQCFTQYNIESFQDGKKFKCKKCSSILTVDRKAYEADSSIEEKKEDEAMTLEQVQEYLCIDSKELGLIIRSGELTGFLDGTVMKFRKEDVEKVKKAKEIQPTLILDEPSSQEESSYEDEGDLIDIDEEMSMTKVMSELHIDENQLRKMMALGELVPTYRDGEAYFRAEDVERVKHTRESQPTLILSDMKVDQSLSGEQLLSFEEAMEDLGMNATAFTELITRENIRPIARGDRSFFKSSEIARLRSSLRQEASTQKKEIKLTFSSPSSAPSSTLKDLLSFEEVLQILGISPKELRQMVVSKKLPSVHSGELIKFRREDVESLKKTQEHPPSSPPSAGIPLFNKPLPQPVEQWLSTPKGTHKQNGTLSLPSLAKNTVALYNPDPSAFTPSALIFLEPASFQDSPNFQELYLVLISTPKESWRVCKVGRVENQWILLGPKGSSPQIYDGQKVQIIGKVSALFTKEIPF